MTCWRKEASRERRLTSCTIRFRSTVRFCTSAGLIRRNLIQVFVLTQLSSAKRQSPHVYGKNSLISIWSYDTESPRVDAHLRDKCTRAPRFLNRGKNCIDYFFRLYRWPLLEWS